MSSASHLAPFVAAVMRDKTVEELMEKVQKQEQQIKDMMKVEITGPEGSPLYMEGQFDEGDWGHRIDWWCPKMKVEEQQMDCPIRNVRNIEVRIGGILQFTVDPENDLKTEFTLVPKSLDEHNDIQKIAIAAEDGSKLYVNVKGWEENEWRTLGDENDYDIPLYTLEEVVPSHCTADFVLLAFHIPKYQALIDKVPLSKEQKEIRQANLHVQQNVNAIIERLEALSQHLEYDEHFEMYSLFYYSLNIKEVSEEFELMSFIDELKERNATKRPQLLERFVAGLQQMAQRQEARNRELEEQERDDEEDEDDDGDY
ncbi:MAG: hypothetical protein SGARI_001013 [Bacillariaceae sp.]